MSTANNIDVDAFIQASLPTPEAPTAGTAVPTDQQVAFIVRELRQVLNGKVNRLNIMLAVTQAVLIARRLPEPGPVKKDLVSKALYWLVDYSTMSDGDKLASRLLLDLGMGQAVDDLVMMATTRIDMKPGRGLFSCCFSPAVQN